MTHQRVVRLLVAAVASFLAISVSQGAADVVSYRPRRYRRNISPGWSIERYYEHLFRGGSDAEEPRSSSVLDSYETCCSSVQGGRSYMEDEYCISGDGAFCAVFDGHGGNAVSRYLRQNLYANVQAAATPLTTVEHYKEAIVAALEKVDKEVSRISHWSFQGSTAVAVWIHNSEDEDTSSKRTVIAANVGDSRAVLSRNGSAIDLTTDHKPNEASEKARVEAMGGKIVWCGGVDSLGKPVPKTGIYRVNGNLALSRAIGDRSEKPIVTAKPDISTYSVEDEDEFIVLGSDGLWDVMSSQEVIAFAHAKLQEAASETDEGTQYDGDESTLTSIQKRLADMIVAEALKRGTTDNVTVIVQWLKRRVE